MNQTTEATGRTLDDAKNAAAQALGLSIDELDFEVMEESPKGLFAKTNYRVRATPKATVEDKPARKPSAKKPESETESIGQGEDVEVIANSEDGEIAVGILNGVLELTGLSVSAKVSDLTGKYVNLEIIGKDVDYFLGEHPTIDSLQYLTNAMFGRKHPNGTRLTLDGGGHRSSRIAELEQLANDVATAVMERNQEAVLDPLPAHERRIIHNALRDVAGVETYSEGEEPDRHIVISPRK